jgi:alpha-tubulin suppressor-like RCC1 family protein
MNFSNAARPIFATRFLTCTSFTSMLQVAAVCTGVFGFVAGANADTNNFVLGWGNNGNGQKSPIPAAANSNVKAIACGNIHTVALKNDGSVIAWGYNDYGQCLGTSANGYRITSTPTGAPVQILGQVLTGVTAIASGSYNTMSLNNSGTVLGWGNNDYGQCLGTDAGGNPINTYETGQPVKIMGQVLTGVTAIASGQQTTIALKDGGVIAWGRNSEGQCTVPNSARSEVSRIASGYNHTIAVKNDGTVIAWGQNNYGQCLGTDSTGSPLTSTPSGQQVKLAGQILTGVAQIVGGNGNCMAIKSDGTVVGWGSNSSGKCMGTDSNGSPIYSTPNGQPVKLAGQLLTGVRQISCGNNYTLVLKNDGTVVGWGSNGSGQCLGTSTVNGESPITTTPNGQPAQLLGKVLSGVTQIAAGSDHTIALKPFLDCNGNGLDDFFDIRDYGAADLNNDGVPDICQGAIDYNTTSPTLGVPTANVAANYTFTNLVMPDNFADVPVTIVSRGDFDAANEYLSVKVDGVTMQRVFETGGINCSVGNNTTTVTIAYATFARAVAVGQLTITLLPSPAVTASECGTGFMTVQMKYLGIGATSDCNNNGLLDTRDIGANPSLDCNGNGHLDACEMAADALLDCNLNGRLDSCDIAAGAPDDDADTHPDQCQYDKGDLDLNGSVDTGDVSIVLLYYGEVNPPFGDFDGNGIVDTGDVSWLLLNFGPVTWP